jgi:phage terminase large subunit GpA-like protein
MTPAALRESNYSAVLASAAKSFRPDPALLVSEWADQHRVLSSRSSPEPGMWRTARTPYLREIMDALSPSSRVEMVIFMKGAQIGATEAGNNWIGFVIHHAPGPMLAVQPTVEMSKRNSKQRIAPLIDECPALRELVREARSRDSGNTILAKEFPGGILVLTGANSAKGLRSMSARYLFLDEVDGYTGDVDGEGDPVPLALARTANFARRKIYIASTPVISGRSRIERLYADSDQSRFHVPCPACLQMQVLKWEQLRWEPGRPQSARYICEHCAAPLQNHQKNWMLPRGEWRADNPGALAGRVRGFHLSSLYSPVGWLTWAQIAEQYEKCGTDPARLQVFSNTVLGLPWTDAAEVPEVDRLYERREDYPVGKLPEGGLVLTAGADVQIRRIEVELVAWGRGKQSWSVDYRVLEGDPYQPEVWKRLAALLDEEFDTAYGGKVRIQKLAIDAGYAPQRVYEFIRQQGPLRSMCIKGNTSSPALVNHPNLIEIGPQGRSMRHGIKLWPVNVSIAKEQVYKWLRSAMPDLERGDPWPVGFCHFPRYGREYFEQLCAERLVTRLTAGGARKPVWEKTRDRNESLDCRIYSMAAMATLRVDTWPPERWDQLQASLTVEKAAAPPPPRSRPPQFQGFGPKEPGE